ncbi:MAG: glycosyltransferase family 2 protein [Crocinitomicaceae bacterium]|nr:glycosyltransferase family 2 protein [Crocinitomicaceae bacterium]
MTVAVAILNYNGADFLAKFLPSVLSNSGDAQIWVIDNQSTDNSVEFLKEHFPQVNLVINESNGGFAKGYNDGLKNIQADYYVLLNSDVEVTPNWIQPCIDHMENDKMIAAVQPKVIAHHDKKNFEHAGAAGGFLDKNFYPFCRGRIFEEVEEDKGQYDQDLEVFWASGACMFVRADLYHQFGGFDEDFFAHMEEIDLCWRMKRQNYKVYYSGSSTVYHVGGGTLNYMNPKKTFLNFRNSLFMIVKNYDGILFFKLFKRLVLDGIAATLFLFKFQFKHFYAVFRSHMTLYANWSKFKKKRIELRKKSTDFNAVGLYKKSIILKKFLGGIKHYSDLDQNDFC